MDIEKSIEREESEDMKRMLSKLMEYLKAVKGWKDSEVVKLLQYIMK